MNGSLLAIRLLAGLLSACEAPQVGAPCLPEQMPENGFDAREAYIETGSVQCETRVCVVYKLGGDPRDSCVATDTHKCASPADIEDSVYCTCRCDSGGVSDADCECPAGYTCTKVLDQGDPGVKGKYCIKSHTVSPGL